ncbi:MAG: formate dehydrogenase accessory sulfurtransferase FdhD [Desulfatiglandales bacterium]
MADLTTTRHIRRYTESGGCTELDDLVIRESRLAIRLDGRDFLQVVLSPSMIEEYVLGFLLTRGLIEKIEDLTSLVIKDDDVLIERALDARIGEDFLNLLESTGTKNIDVEKDPRLFQKKAEAKFSVPVKVLIDCVRQLSHMPLYNCTGATHCAILFSPEGRPLVSAEDIGRHNSVDKVIGGGLKTGLDFSATWLAVSGRLPADMVHKAAIVGIPLIASVSAPTSAGVHTGEKAGVTVVGFTRHQRFNCYCHPERIG